MLTWPEKVSNEEMQNKLSAKRRSCGAFIFGVTSELNTCRFAVATCDREEEKITRHVSLRSAVFYFYIRMTSCPFYLRAFSSTARQVIDTWSGEETAFGLILAHIRRDWHHVVEEKVKMKAKVHLVTLVEVERYTGDIPRYHGTRSLQRFQFDFDKLRLMELTLQKWRILLCRPALCRSTRTLKILWNNNYYHYFKKRSIIRKILMLHLVSNRFTMK